AAKNFRYSDYIKIILKEEEMTERFKTDEKLISKIIPFIPDIEIVFDEDTEDGTIVLDNGSEIVDASIPTQLDFLKEILNNTRGVSDDDEDFELGNAPDSIFSGGAEISEEFPAEISGDTVETAAFAENTEAEVPVDFAAETLACIAEAEAAVQNAAAEAVAENDSGFAGSLLDGGMGIPEDVPADDFVSAVSEALPASEVDEAVPETEVAETKKTTKKRAKKSEE
ncbi:MAG: hypothetical protein K2N71_08665, partial [Oscillospiraceae bacterium]|nr:hypothetical protein [Oscillospiraceae bacterium]